MNNRYVLLLLLLMMPSVVASARQTDNRDAQPISDFRIDRSKPYVYLVVKSVGPRKPLDVDEPTTGITLQLKNNCTVPISIVTFTSANGLVDGVYQVMDEVIPNPLAEGEQPGSGATGVKTGQKDLTDIILWPNQTEEELRAAASESARLSANPAHKVEFPRPHGYTDQLVLGRKDLTVIPPGGMASFSYPANHLGQTWHLEIPFRLALERRSSIRPPYSYVALFLEDLSEGDRGSILQSKAFKSTNSGSTPVPEAKSSRSPR